MRGGLMPQIVASVRILAIMTLALGLAYPLAMTALAQVAFDGRADGSLVRVDGEIVGSRLIAQRFTSPAYFHPRPSAAEFDASASMASNLGPNNPTLIEAVTDRVEAYRDENGLDGGVEVPVDAVTTSGSGLDPDISPANARLQAGRVAAARGLDVGVVLALIDDPIDRRPLGVLGDGVVNVLELNIALDRLTVQP